MTAVKITKKGFHNDVKHINSAQSQVAMIMGCKPEMSSLFLKNYQMVEEILTDQATRFLYQLWFPEKHFPNNMSQFFWREVGELMKRGVVFEVVTSDMTSVTFVTPRRQEEREGIPETVLGWDKRILEYKCPELGEWVEHPITVAYGRDTQEVYKLYPF